MHARARIARYAHTIIYHGTFRTYSVTLSKYRQEANADYQPIIDFFYKKVQKYLVSSKKSSTFAPAFERDSVYILPFPLQVSA